MKISIKKNLSFLFVLCIFRLIPMIMTIIKDSVGYIYVCIFYIYICIYINYQLFYVLKLSSYCRVSKKNIIHSSFNSLFLKFYAVQSDLFTYVLKFMTYVSLSFYNLILFQGSSGVNWWNAWLRENRRSWITESGSLHLHT